MPRIQRHPQDLNTPEPKSLAALAPASLCPAVSAKLLQLSEADPSAAKIKDQQEKEAPSRVWPSSPKYTIAMLRRMAAKAGSSPP